MAAPLMEMVTQRGELHQHWGSSKAQLVHKIEVGILMNQTVSLVVLYAIICLARSKHVDCHGNRCTECDRAPAKLA